MTLDWNGHIPQDLHISALSFSYIAFFYYNFNKFAILIDLLKDLFRDSYILNGRSGEKTSVIILIIDPVREFIKKKPKRFIT